MTGVGWIDIATLVAYFAVVLGVGVFKGRGARQDTGSFFVARGTLPWWVIAATFVATGMNTEQLVGQNGMSYKIGLPMLNWYFIVFIVYSLLIFIFLPVYLRNRVSTMPEYLGKRFNAACQNVFTVILILTYVFMNLAVVFYGGAKLLEVIFGLNIWEGVILIGIVAGLYTMYGGMRSAAYAATIQFALIFISGFFLMYLAYNRLPNGWSDVVAAAPCGFHLMKPTDYPEIPWHAVPLTLLGIHLYYSCANQALVQGCFGARREWDARIGLIVAGFCVVLRPFVEIFPGMCCRAIAVFDPSFELGNQPVDNVLPMMIRQLVGPGFRGLILIGILASVMSTIAAFLNSISTLFTLDVYKKWIDPNASEKRLVKVGTIATCVLMVFSILYSPCIGYLSGGIFQYFQTLASYVTVPLATVFLLGVLWKRATSAGALSVMILGVPLGLLVNYVFVPLCFSPEVISKYSLGNPFIVGAMTQVLCVALMVLVSLATKPKDLETVAPLTFSVKNLRLPDDEPKRPFYQSVPFWWVIFVAFYVGIYIWLW
ncbi:MAG: sodium/solute symporter [Thermoguttaceae bacterium]|nr:sodium/solute symporter [Thermoguttaceae bacterium]